VKVSPQCNFGLLRVAPCNSFFRLFLLTCLIIYGHSASAQQVPFTRGVNLTSWFQTGSPQQIQAGKYTFEDFQKIQSLGCDVIRLPINLHAMTNGAPGYQLDPLFLEFLDQAVDWAEELGIYLILDNHTFDPAVGTDPNIGPLLESVWTQMAMHFQNRTQYVIYEVLNEPHDISDQQWNAIQMGVIDAIRAVDQEHFIVIGPAGWNSFHNLDDMPVYPQKKLIYTFHFYDPFIFTHQGASWTDPSLVPLAQVPFPYEAGGMPDFPAALSGTWIQSAFNDYPNTGTAASVRSLIDIAVQFQQDRNVPVFCGEFGAYIPNSSNEDRVEYYSLVRSYMEEKNIPWTMWDYHGGFGIFEEGGHNLFEHDLNVALLEALGMNVPDQTPYVKQPESIGFPLYTDQIGPQILESSSGDSKISYYSQDSPNNGNYCIRWEDGARYQHIGLDLQPNKDLSQLYAQNYALDFIFRGTAPLSFDIRFVDTDTGPEDHPWRMRYNIDESVVPFDSRWHHLHIPLADFIEGGAWEEEWFPPEDKFDWASIDRLEIVAEHEDMGNAKLWFDNLYISNQDTAQIHDQSVFELVTGLDDPDFNDNFSIYPNPAQDQIFITARARIGPNLNYTILDGTGKVVESVDFLNETAVDLSTLATGLYFIKVSDVRGNLKTQRILKY
jgi:endoglucanase